MNIITVIPARKNSKGIPHKNMKYIDCKPLIAYAIEKAFGHALIKDVIVSTDDVNVIEYIEDNYRGYKIIIHDRPEALATDISPIVDTLQDVIIKYEQETKTHVDGVCLLQPTSPLRTWKTIEDCLRLFEQKEVNTVFTVHKEEYPAKYYFYETHKPVIEDSNRISYRRQSFPECVMRNGAVFVIDRETIFEGKITGEKFKFYLTSKTEGLDINTTEDLNFCRAIMYSPLDK